MKPRKTYWIVGLLIWLAAIQSGWSFYNPHQGKWLSRDPIQEQGGKNLYGFVRNDAINFQDLLGLTDVYVNLYYNKGIPITEAIKQRVNKTLNDCLKTCKSCVAGTKKFIILWWRTDRDLKDQKELDLGPQSYPLLDATGFGVLLRGNPDMNFIGHTHGYVSEINVERLQEAIVPYNATLDVAMASSIAHEVALHAIAGLTDMFMFGVPGYADSSPSIVGTGLSPQTCQKLCEKLKLDK